MNLLIAFHFCGNNREKVYEFLTSIGYKEQFGLSFKTEVVSFILKNHYPQILKSDSKLIDDVFNLIKLRNHFAHRHFSNHTTEGVSFMVIKTKRSKPIQDEQHITEKELMEHSSRIEEIELKLKNIIDENYPRENEAAT